MKLSLNWLRSFLPDLAGPAAEVSAVAETLTRIGFEVEGTTPVAAGLSGLRIAEVLAKRPHPQADKLKLVRIRAGSTEEEVVCGAPNVPEPGGRVCWAAPGSILSGGLKIETRPVRGVVSPGMLCSEAELGLSSEVDGIIILSTSEAPETGGDFLQHFGLVDHVLEVNVTPNRADALSHLGIARELGGALGLKVVWPEPFAGMPLAGAAVVAGAALRGIKIADEDGCPRYQGRWITDVIVGPSPLMMRARLGSCGVRSINNLVDVTNHILLELGHPLHAFDDARLQGDIRVRRAGAGETMTTLDAVERRLEAGDLVIADDRGPVALAGVMGGATSEVAPDTRTVFLESATFDPVSIRRTARRVALHSESSHRFERGVDAEGIPAAAARAAAMLALLGGGKILDTTVDVYPRRAMRRTVDLSIARLRRVSGRLDHDAASAARTLATVVEDVAVAGQGALAVLTAAVPSFRPDLRGAEDLIEEIMRLDGYAAIDGRNPVENARPTASPELPLDRARDRLAACGLHEVVTWGFVPRASLQALAPDGDAPVLTDGVVVKNPISADYEVMRTSLLPGLLETARRNLARGALAPCVFEVGPVVRKKSGAPGAPAIDAIEESLMAAALLCGPRAGWLRSDGDVDFYDAKRVLLDLLTAFGVDNADVQPGADVPYLHPGVAGTVLRDGVIVARVGEVHPVVRHRMGVGTTCFYVEAALRPLTGGVQAIRSSPPPRYPAAARDVSFFVDVDVTAGTQRQGFLAAGEALLIDMRVLEDFRDPVRVPAGKKGMLWTLTYRTDDRTLTDEEVERAHAGVVGALRNHVNVDIR